MNGREIELYFNVKAMNDIAERCGGSIDNLADTMKNQSDFENLKFVCGIMTDLANGAVVKRNCALFIVGAIISTLPTAINTIFPALFNGFRAAAT